MNLNLKQDRSLMAYIIVSVIAILWNLMTIGHSLPWCDEVMLLDTNATMHYYGEWATTAYNDYGQGTRSFNVYMPLYNWLMYIWVSIFGFSMLVIRTFNLVFAFMLGWALLHLAKLINRQNFSKVTVILYALCFWCTDVMMMTYRMSRPEIVGSLMTVIFAIYLYKTLTSGRKYIWQMILFAALSILAGIQSALYIVLGLIFVAFFFRPLNRLITPSICCVIGLCLGFLAALVHMIYFQEGRAFIICIMNSSAVIMKIWGGIRSIIYPLLGKEVTPLGIPVSNEGDISLIEKIMGIFAYLGASVLFISNIILIIFNRVWKNIQEYKMPVLCFLFSNVIIIRKIGFFAGISTFILFAVAILFAFQQKSAIEHKNEAVVISPSIKIRKTPSMSAETLFVIHKGTEVDIIDKTIPTWRQIQLGDGRQGWLATNQIEEI